jgi:hypothetical protein
MVSSVQNDRVIYKLFTVHKLFLHLRAKEMLEYVFYNL